MSALKDIFSNIIYYGLESIGKYYSSYRGYVVDNEDPEHMGRVKVRIPSVTKGKEHPTWAYPKTQWGGNGYGMQMLPVKGEIVWVEFEHGDTRFPIWNFAHRAIGEKPEEFISSKIYGIKTPKGQTVIINDEIEEIIINGGDNFGLVKVFELTTRLNSVEDKVEEFLNHYRTHQIVDPISGVAGPLMPTPPAPINPTKTKQEDIENTKVKH